MISLTNCNFKPAISYNYEWIEGGTTESVISMNTYNYLHVVRRKKKNTIIKFKPSNFDIKKNESKLLSLFDGKTSISMKYILKETRVTRFNIIGALKEIAYYDCRVFKWKLK